MPSPRTIRIPDAATLAEQIQDLKAAQTIDANPERTASRQITAEEPVTARIRKRAEAANSEKPTMEA